jgi:hypothetical protein
MSGRFILTVAIACVLVLGVFVLIEISIRLPAAGVALSSAIPAGPAKAIDTLVTLTSLFVTLALGVFGGIGFLVKGFLQADFELTAEECWLLAGSAAAAFVSVFAGHLTYWNLFRMLSNSILDFDTAAVGWPVRIEYVSLMLAVLLLFGGIFHAAARRIAAPAKPQLPAEESKAAV